MISCTISSLQSTLKESLVSHPIFPLLGESIVAAKSEKPFISAMVNTYPLRATRNRTLIYTTTLTCLLQNVSKASVIPDCIGDNFLRCVVFMFQDSKLNRQRDELFEKTMAKFFVTLTEALKKEDVSRETRLAVIKKLLLASGVLQFDTVTKSRYVFSCPVLSVQLQSWMVLITRVQCIFMHTSLIWAKNWHLGYVSLLSLGWIGLRMLSSALANSLFPA